MPNTPIDAHPADWASMDHEGNYASREIKHRYAPATHEKLLFWGRFSYCSYVFGIWSKN